MALAERLNFVRKNKEINQAKLGKLVEASCDIIRKHEREENTPSIGEASRIDDALGVTLDYLKKDRGVTAKVKVFDIIDTYLRDFKTRQTYS
jgi:ribosome-binding protein aMBF1 (putative translation factor)